MPIIGVRSLVERPDKTISEEIQYYKIDPISYMNICPDCQDEALCFIFNLIRIRSLNKMELTDQAKFEDIKAVPGSTLKDLKYLNNMFEKYHNIELFGPVQTVEMNSCLKVADNLN
jgi:hypothetical protein